MTKPFVIGFFLMLSLSNYEIATHIGYDHALRGLLHLALAAMMMGITLYEAKKYFRK